MRYSPAPKTASYYIAQRLLFAVWFVFAYLLATQNWSLAHFTANPWDVLGRFYMLLGAIGAYGFWLYSLGVAAPPMRVFGALFGVLVGFGLLALRLRGNEWFSGASPDTVSALLMTIMQTAAGIFAIAAAFTVLYVQIAIDAFSLRASRLLLRDWSFVFLVIDFLLIIMISGVLALSGGWSLAAPPGVVGFLGLALFVYGLIMMAGYAINAVNVLTPEALTQNTRLLVNAKDVWEVALQATLGRRYVDFKMGELEGIKAHVPSTAGEWRRFDERTRLLIDSAIHMIQARESQSVGASIDEISQYSLPIDRNDRSSLMDSVQLAYKAGALIEIWDAAIRQQDSMTASLLISAFRSLIPRHVLSPELSETDVLDVVLRDRLIRDTGAMGWRDLRVTCIELLPVRHDVPLDRLTEMAALRIDKASAQAKDVARREMQVRSVSMVPRGLGESLVAEQVLDEESAWAVFHCMRSLGIYAATVGYAGTFADACALLNTLGEHYERFNRSISREMARLAQEMGERWIACFPENSDPTPYGEYLLRNAIETNVIRARRSDEAKERWASQFFAETHLDALEGLAICCIKHDQWKRLKATLDSFVVLVPFIHLARGHAALCLQTIAMSEAASTKSQVGPFWVSTALAFIEKDLGPERTKCYGYLRRGAEALAQAGFLRENEQEASHLERLMNEVSSGDT